MNTYTPEYEQQQLLLHAQRPDYGTSGSNYAGQIIKFSRAIRTEDILDYGCGKSTLAKSLPFPIKQYDPFIPEFSARPSPADLVVCTDVMEHIEEEFVASVLADIYSLTNKAVFFQVATRPAAKTLPDGRNAHITQKPPGWWMVQLCTLFDPMHMQDIGGGFIFIGLKKQS